MHTPCVITGARTRRVYAYTEYIYTPRVVTGVSFAHQNYSFTERALAVCTQFVIVYELCRVEACLFARIPTLALETEE